MYVDRTRDPFFLSCILGRCRFTERFKQGVWPHKMYCVNKALLWLDVCY